MNPADFARIHPTIMGSATYLPITWRLSLQFP
jgi:hypothetical protein